MTAGAVRLPVVEPDSRISGHVLPVDDVAEVVHQTGTNVASPADEDGVINCTEQIQLTNRRASEAPSRRRGASLASIFVSWIGEAQLITGLCQLVMRR